MSKIFGKVVGNTAATPIRIPEVNNVLKGFASGCPLILTDVSPIKHDIIACEDVGATAIVRCGKNLLNVFGRTEISLKSASPDTKRDFSFDKYYTNIAVTNYSQTSAVTAELIDGVWNVTTTINGYGIGFPVRALPNTRYSCSGTYDGTLSLALYDWEGVFIKSQSTTNSFVTPENCEIIMVCFIPSSKNTLCQFSNVQLEFGSAKTEYEPYVEPIEYTSDQEPIKIPSLYPTTVLYERGGAGTVTAEYNRDINKVISNLENAILSIGGNV